jgi:hypothetical protein
MNREIFKVDFNGVVWSTYGGCDKIVLCCQTLLFRRKVVSMRSTQGAQTALLLPHESASQAKRDGGRNFFANHRVWKLSFSLASLLLL